MKFYFFSKKDPKKEPIGKIDANSIEEAVEKFSYIKRLPIQKFLSIFSILRQS